MPESAEKSVDCGDKAKDNDPRLRAWLSSEDKRTGTGASSSKVKRTGSKWSVVSIDEEDPSSKPKANTLPTIEEDSPPKPEYHRPSAEPKFVFDMTDEDTDALSDDTSVKAPHHIGLWQDLSEVEEARHVAFRLECVKKTIADEVAEQEAEKEVVARDKPAEQIDAKGPDPAKN